MSRDAADVLVIGAGAAGLTAAIHAARAGARTLLLETRAKPGAKIRVSGGGRCNVLPSRFSLDDFHTSGSVHALRKVLRSWPLDDVRAFFEDDLGVALKREPTGKLFPVSDQSREIVTALLAAVERSGAELRAGRRITGLRSAADGFAAETEDGARLHARRVILATGGLSLPKTGSDGAGIAMARKLGHTVVPTYPALVALRGDDPRWRELAGVSVDVRLRAVRGDRVLEERSGSFLVSHRGFSGPVVLDLSRHVTAPAAEDVRLLAHWGGGEDGSWDRALQAGGRGTVASVLRERLPRRLAELLAEQSGADAGTRTSELTRDARLRLVEALERFALPVSGKNEGYRAAEVTGGGIPLSEVVTDTLESRVASGLHLCGEMLDVIGRVGGYNFLWAWVSGRRAGLAAAAG